MKQNANTIIRHHLLEIILWPNDDGTFTEIRNSVDRLKELDIYKDFKCTIEMTCSEHAKLHGLGLDRKGKVAANAWKPGHKPWNTNVPMTAETKLKVSEGTKLGMRRNWDKFITENIKAVARGASRREWISNRFKELKSKDPSLTWNSVQKQLNSEWKNNA